MLAYVSLSLLPLWQKMARTITLDNTGQFDPLLNITDNSVVFDKLRQDKSKQPLTCQGSVSVDSEAPDIVFICSIVDYGIHAYIEAVRQILSPKSVLVY